MRTLLLCLLLPLVSCGALRPGGQTLQRSDLLKKLERIGDAVLQIEGYRILEKEAPQLIPLIDKPLVQEVDGVEVVTPADGKLSLSEVSRFIMEADEIDLGIVAYVLLRDKL